MKTENRKIENSKNGDAHLHPDTSSLFIQNILRFNCNLCSKY